jgi:hypothetical protein
MEEEDDDDECYYYVTHWPEDDQPLVETHSRVIYANKY